MTTTEAHAIARAVQDRRAELRRYLDWYATNPVGKTWTEGTASVAEYRARLDELDRLLLFANVAEMTEGADPRAGCCAEWEGFDQPCSGHATRFDAVGRPVG